MKQEIFEKPQVDVYMKVSLGEWDYKLDILDDYLADEDTLCTPDEGFGTDTFMGLMTSLNTDLSQQLM